MEKARNLSAGMGAALAVFLCFCVASARAEENLGDSWFALPGIHRAPVMSLGQPRVAASMNLGLAVTQARDGEHYRLIGIPAAGWVLAPWLELGVLADARSDQHPGDDSGFVSDPRAVARLGGEVATGFQTGAQLGLWLPGTESPGDTVDSASPEATLFSAWQPGPLTLTIYAGYRLDRSRNAGRNAARLSQGDRLALGLSDYDALLTGLGSGYRFGAWVFLAEASSEMLVGEGAPGVSASPLRLSVGTRYLASSRLQLEGLIEASLATPPNVGPLEPLVIIEPTVTALFGVRYRFVGEPAIEGPPKKLSPKKPRVVVKPAPAEKPKTSLAVVVKGKNEELLTDAKVLLQQGEAQTPLEPDADGRFAMADLDLGPIKLSFRASGYVPVSKEITLGMEPTSLELKLEPTLTGQIRGLLRSFGGKPVQGTVTIEPAGLRITSDETGSFEVDVVPGTYRVTIEAQGFMTQSRKVNVAKDEVIVFNADLVKR